MKANHRYTFTAIFLCTLINQSSQFKRCAEKATSNQTRDSSESCIAAGNIIANIMLIIVAMS